MIIALPATGHDHLADALVRELGFKRSHVDQPLRDLLFELDPLVDSGTTLANMGASPRLTSRLELVGTWDRLLNPPRPGASSDRVANETKRLLDVLRRRGLGAPATLEGDVVLVGVETVTHGDRTRYSNTPSGASGIQFVALADRFLDEGAGVNHWIDPAGVVGEQAAIVAYVQQCRQPRVMVIHDEVAPGPTVAEFEESLKAPLLVLDTETGNVTASPELEDYSKQAGLVYEPPTAAEHAEYLAAIAADAKQATRVPTRTVVLGPGQEPPAPDPDVEVVTFEQAKALYDDVAAGKYLTDEQRAEVEAELEPSED